MTINIINYFQGIVEELPDIVVAIDVNYLVVVANKTYKNLANKVFGVIPILGDKFGKIIITEKETELLSIMIDGFSAALANNTRSSVYKLNQGLLVNKYFEATFFPIKDENSVIVGSACLAKDVTERETLISSLKSITNIFSLSSKLAKLAPWKFDIENNVYIFNDEIYSLYGTSVAKEGLTMSPEVFTNKIIYTEDKPMVKDFFDKVLKSQELEQIIELESRITRLDNGQTRIIKVLAKIARNKEGKILEFYGTNQDITEQRMAEENLKRIQEEENTIFDSIPAWVVFKDRENRFIRVNKAYADALGISKDQLENKSLFDIYSKELAEKYWKDDLEVIESGKTKNNIIELTITKNGERWIQTDKIPYCDVSGKVVGVIAFAIDITQQKKNEQEIKDKVIELEKFNKLFLNRENKMVELKQEMEELKKKSG